MEKETALKILRDRHANALFSERTALETLIPELAESEDERIKKELIEFVDINTLSVEERHYRWIDWLEKQKYAWSEEDENMREKLLFLMKEENSRESWGGCYEWLKSINMNEHQPKKIMKKIMFNDKYGLTEAVLHGRKTMTRRLVKDANLLQWLHEMEVAEYAIKGTILEEYSPYKVGEVVAIAQSYKDVYDSIKNPCELFSDRLFNSLLKEHKGWKNKMFVKADLMPNRIRITDLKVERLQDISDEDCLKEGIFDTMSNRTYHYRYPYSPRNYITPREAFAALIDKVSGRGTWDLNPWVFAYTYDVLQVK